MAFGPPAQQLFAGLFRRQRTALEAQFLEEGPGLAHFGSGAKAKQVHNGIAIKVRPDPRQVLLCRELGNPLFQMVVVTSQPASFALIAGGDISAD